jgi:L-ribulose-5-phosphate 3-epimerase
MMMEESMTNTGYPLTVRLIGSTSMKKITETGYSGATVIEAMNWDYMDLSTKEFLQEAFERAKRLEQATLSGKFQSRR